MELNSELVRAFQYVENKYLDIAEQEKTVRGEAGQSIRKKALRGKLGQEKTVRGEAGQSSREKALWRKTEQGTWPAGRVAAACILGLILLLALPAAAIAANWFGLRDLLLPGRGEHIGGSKTQTDINSAAGDGHAEGGASDAQGVISLAGYQGSLEWQALAEWKEFLEEYEGDDALQQATGNRLDASFARYSCYMVHSREMADKMDALAEKYDLTLHTAAYDLQAYPELLEPCGDFLGQGYSYGGYMYEDGTFQLEGSLELVTGMWDFQLLRSVKGTFHDAMLDIGDAADYEEWRYDAACGVTAALALGPDKALVLVDLADCFVTVSVYSIIQPAPAGADEGVTR
ncbi:MAG: hypothetical protein NC305_19245, partial [Lachnospiraceae bacterium]|nr:hypothetical protein [Lachnospiraceae bacterium]